MLRILLLTYHLWQRVGQAYDNAAWHLFWYWILPVCGAVLLYDHFFRDRIDRMRMRKLGRPPNNFDLGGTELGDEFSDLEERKAKGAR